MWLDHRNYLDSPGDLGLLTFTLGCLEGVWLEAKVLLQVVDGHGQSGDLIIRNRAFVAAITTPATRPSRASGRIWSPVAPEQPSSHAVLAVARMSTSSRLTGSRARSSFRTFRACSSARSELTPNSRPGRAAKTATRTDPAVCRHRQMWGSVEQRSAGCDRRKVRWPRTASRASCAADGEHEPVSHRLGAATASTS